MLTVSKIERDSAKMASISSNDLPAVSGKKKYTIGINEAHVTV